MDDDLIHDNDKIPLNSIDNLRRLMNINQTGLMYNRYDSRVDIDQVRWIVPLV